MKPYFFKAVALLCFTLDLGDKLIGIKDGGILLTLGLIAIMIDSIENTKG